MFYHKNFFAQWETVSCNFNFLIVTLNLPTNLFFGSCFVWMHASYHNVLRSLGVKSNDIQIFLASFGSILNSLELDSHESSETASVMSFSIVWLSRDMQSGTQRWCTQRIWGWNLYLFSKKSTNKTEFILEIVFVIYKER